MGGGDSDDPRRLVLRMEVDLGWMRFAIPVAHQPGREPPPRRQRLPGITIHR